MTCFGSLPISVDLIDSCACAVNFYTFPFPFLVEVAGDGQGEEWGRGRVIKIELDKYILRAQIRVGPIAEFEFNAMFDFHSFYHGMRIMMKKKKMMMIMTMRIVVVVLNMTMMLMVMMKT